MTTENHFDASAGVDRAYFAHLGEGRFLIPRCDDCNRYHFYPRLICPHCGSASLQWHAPSGRGIVYSVTVVRRADGDYNVCLVDLEEGPRLMSRIVDLPPADVRIGMRVEAGIVSEAAGPLLVFRPAEENHDE